MKKLIFLFYGFFPRILYSKQMSTNMQSICEITSNRPPTSPLRCDYRNFEAGASRDGPLRCVDRASRAGPLRCDAGASRNDPIVFRVPPRPLQEFEIPVLNMNLIDDFEVLTDDFINVCLSSEKSPGFKADSYKTPPRPIAKISQPEPAEYAHYQAHLRKRRSENPVESSVFDLPPRIVRQRL